MSLSQSVNFEWRGEGEGAERGGGVRRELGLRWLGVLLLRYIASHKQTNQHESANIS